MDKDGQPDPNTWVHQPDVLDEVLRAGYCDSPPFTPPKASYPPLAVAHDLLICQSPSTGFILS